MPLGKIETGIMKAGMDITITPPGNLHAKVMTIEMHHKNLEEATPGDYVGFNVKGLSVKQLRRGYVASDS